MALKTKNRTHSFLKLMQTSFTPVFLQAYNCEKDGKGRRRHSMGTDGRDGKEAQRMCHMKLHNKLSSLFQIPEPEVV
jgi:hypothetical protein